MLQYVVSWVNRFEGLHWRTFPKNTSEQEVISEYNSCYSEQSIGDKDWKLVCIDTDENKRSIVCMNES